MKIDTHMILKKESPQNVSIYRWILNSLKFLYHSLLYLWKFNLYSGFYFNEFFYISGSLILKFIRLFTTIIITI